MVSLYLLWCKLNLAIYCVHAGCHKLYWFLHLFTHFYYNYMFYKWTCLLIFGYCIIINCFVVRLIYEGTWSYRGQSFLAIGPSGPCMCSRGHMVLVHWVLGTSYPRNVSSPILGGTRDTVTTCLGTGLAAYIRPQTLNNVTLMKLIVVKYPAFVMGVPNCHNDVKNHKYNAYTVYAVLCNCIYNLSVWLNQLSVVTWKRCGPLPMIQYTYGSQAKGCLMRPN